MEETFIAIIGILVFIVIYTIVFYHRLRKEYLNLKIEIYTLQKKNVMLEKEVSSLQQKNSDHNKYKWAYENLPVFRVGQNTKGHKIESIQLIYKRREISHKGTSPLQTLISHAASFLFKEYEWEYTTTLGKKIRESELKNL